MADIHVTKAGFVCIWHQVIVQFVGEYSA